MNLQSPIWINIMLFISFLILTMMWEIWWSAVCHYFIGTVLQLYVLAEANLCHGGIWAISSTNMGIWWFIIKPKVDPSKQPRGWMGCHLQKQAIPSICAKLCQSYLHCFLKGWLSLTHCKYRYILFSPLFYWHGNLKSLYSRMSIQHKFIQNNLFKHLEANHFDFKGHN